MVTWSGATGVLVVFGLLFGAGPIGAFDPAMTLTRVRPGTAALSRVFREGVTRSPTFAALVDRLERSHWLVFVYRGACPDPAVAGCLLHTVGRYGDDPYLRILVNPWRVGHPDREISTIAHELQHALEIVEAVEVIDSASLTRHFRRIGYVSAESAWLIAYETVAARRTGDQVLSELLRAGRHAEISSLDR
jgi:hypothetical protein